MIKYMFKVHSTVFKKMEFKDIGFFILSTVGLTVLDTLLVTCPSKGENVDLAFENPMPNLQGCFNPIFPP